MNTEALKEVAEIAKNLSVTFDGKLNSETVVEAVKEIMPYFWMSKIMEFAGTCIWSAALVVSAYLVGKAVIKAIKKRED